MDKTNEFNQVDNNELTVGNNSGANIPEYAHLESSFNDALSLINDVVLKRYLSSLSELDVIELSEDIKSKELAQSVRLCKINKLVYQKDEFALYKLATVLNSVSGFDCSVFILMKSDGRKTDYYMGVRANNSSRSVFNLYSTLSCSLKAQFPGVEIDNVSNEAVDEILQSVNDEDYAVSSLSCVANLKNSDIKDNASFIQGLEKLSNSMQGSKYTAIIIADSMSQDDIGIIRNSYENVYTALSPFATNQVNYSQNASYSLASGTSTNHTEGSSESEQTSNSHAVSQTDEKTKKGKKIAAASQIATSAIAGAATAANPLIGIAVSQILNPVNEGINYAVDINKKDITDTTQESKSRESNTSDAFGTNETETEQTGTAQGSTLTIQNKRISNILSRLDRQMERLDDFESLGMWGCSAYFIAENLSVSERAANTYRSLMQGEGSGVETAAVNTWAKELDKGIQSNQIKEYLARFINPVFAYRFGNNICEVSATSFVSGNELALHMGLPRHSVCGLPVIEHAEFGKEVITYDNMQSAHSMLLGNIFDMGSKCNTPVRLDINSLASHTFITGSTGVGKSNTVYTILDNLSRNNVKFMVIEPAKGEYRHVFGGRSDVTVLGTNNKVFDNMLRINPFSFPTDSMLVTEHVDRLVEIFNVCWPMYAAMPAVLKDAILNAYKNCGWDIKKSVNKYNLFPTFMDLMQEIGNVVNSSSYSADTKGDYIGSLQTRVKSLTDGVNGQIFCGKETDNALLFDTNVIIDISRIGSSETKALIMGMLILKMDEYRTDTTVGMNLPLKHITVLEEAHNILPRTSTEQSQDSSNIKGKSVELISNAIAQMRSCGEGFIIADQSPTSVDISAIKNTNTKIIMNLPEGNDKECAGKSAALNDEQIEEITKLPTGVAVVYQNKWVEPVLCIIDKFDGEIHTTKKSHKADDEIIIDESKLRAELIKLILSYKSAGRYSFDVDYIKQNIDDSELSSYVKFIAYKFIEQENDRPSLNFKTLCDYVSEIVIADKTFNQTISRTSDIALDSELNKKIAPLLNNTNILMDVKQCIMYKYAFETPNGKQRYLAWRDLIKKGAK